MDSIRKDKRFPSPPYYVSKECRLIPEAVDKELTRLDEEVEFWHRQFDMLSDILKCKEQNLSLDMAAHKAMGMGNLKP